MDYEQYLRENPMPTKRVDNDDYYIVECHYEFVRIDEDVDEDIDNDG